MRAVLGIDAAWTERAPSGVALIAEAAEGWRCVAVAPSYGAFISLAHGRTIDGTASVRGARPDPAALLDAARTLLGGQRVRLVAVDMPVATTPIMGRREADRAIARAFGGQGCGTHSPSATRPGPISTLFSRGFKTCGYGLATAGTAIGAPDHLIEVYPHPALLALMNRSYRVPYKVARSKRYWRDLSLAGRHTRLLDAFSEILAALETSLHGVDLHLSITIQGTSLVRLKQYEDMLDALVCAWVGAKYLAGESEPYGDETAAIWVPRPQSPGI